MGNHFYQYLQNYRRSQVCVKCCCETHGSARNSSNGPSKSFKTLGATLADQKALKPIRPCVAITIKSALTRLASLTMDLAGSPRATSAVVALMMSARTRR